MIVSQVQNTESAETDRAYKLFARYINQWADQVSVSDNFKKKLNVL